MKDPISKDNLKSMLKALKVTVEESLEVINSEATLPFIRENGCFNVYCCSCDRFMAEYCELVDIPLDINQCSKCSETKEERNKREAHEIFKKLETKRNELEVLENNIRQMEVLKKKILSENPTLTQVRY